MAPGHGITRLLSGASCWKSILARGATRLRLCALASGFHLWTEHSKNSAVAALGSFAKRKILPGDAEPSWKVQTAIASSWLPWVHRLFHKRTSEQVKHG